MTALLCACAAQPDRATDADTLRKLKLAVWPSIYRTQDAAALDEFLADEFVMITNSGDVVPKADEVASLADTPWNGPDDFVYTIADIVFVDDNTAIVYGRGDSTRQNDAGEPCAHSYLSSNTFARRGSAWKPVMSHVSGVRCEPL